MSHLVPCPGCARHVRQSEAKCPFCGVGVSLGHVAPPTLPRARLNRAALFAFKASVVGATALVGCSEDNEGGPVPIYGGSPAAGASFGGSPVYGGPPEGGAGNTSGGSSAASGGMQGEAGGELGGAGPSLGGEGPGTGGESSAGGDANAGGAGDGDAGAGGIGEPVAVYGAPPSI